MTHPFRIETSVEIEATPEEVWEAITIGEQLDGWWIGAPNEVEPRLGGVVRQNFGGQVSESTITAWEPPHHFVDEGTPGPDGVVHAMEFTLEGRSGTTTVRFVHSGFLGDDWESEYEALAEGDPMYIHQLAQYVQFFRGRPVAIMEHFQPDITDRQAAMAILLGAWASATLSRWATRCGSSRPGSGPSRARWTTCRRPSSACAPTTRSTGSRSSRWVAASTWATTSTGTMSTWRPSPRPGRRGWTGPSRPAGGVRPLGSPRALGGRLAHSRRSTRPRPAVWYQWRHARVRSTQRACRSGCMRMTAVR